jgi:hypothetical protein
MVREGLHFFGATLTQAVTVDPAPAPAARDLSLLGGRFKVEVSWRDHSGRAGFGRVIPSNDQTGFFWFFDPANTELVVKMLDGGTVNHEFWNFYGALSDVEYWIDVTDTVTGATHQYHNPEGNLCGGADTQSFPSTTKTVSTGDLSLIGNAPAAPATLAGSTCVADAQSLCLLSGRFQVTVQFRNPNDGSTGAGQAVRGSDQSGTFWFFAPTNTELVVKLLDGRPLNGKYWAFYGALSNVEYWVTVRDSTTGASKRYHNRQGNFCGLADTAAF